MSTTEITDGLQERITAAPKTLIATKIKQARVESQLSHDRLGERVGVLRQHLIKLEQGKHRPGAPLLARIADATGRDPDWFLEDGGAVSVPFRPGRHSDDRGSRPG